METRMFALNPIVDKNGIQLRLQPVGDYWVYQQNGFQFRWWSYNLQQLLDILAHQGGILCDNKGRILKVSLPENI